ncbi:MAG: hypothetical protein JXB35_01340 [Anaerolineae bacterium]|nr:hypothetical protein [Anaerolineae bacterium]
MSTRGPVIQILSLVLLIAGIGAGPPTGRLSTWRAVEAAYPERFEVHVHPISQDAAACPEMVFPVSWQVTRAIYADVTGDENLECILLVWRPWADWPIMRWSNMPSPIAANHDAENYSAHLILVVPDAERGYREIWAGSALGIPILHFRTGDMYRDGAIEIIAFEGAYHRGRYGPAETVAVWAWNGFGFTLEWRGDPGADTLLRWIDYQSTTTSERR